MGILFAPSQAVNEKCELLTEKAVISRQANTALGLHEAPPSGGKLFRLVRRRRGEPVAGIEGPIYEYS